MSNRGLDEISDDFPEEFFKLKVMPELMKSAEFGGGGPKAVTVVLKIAAKISKEDFDSKITPFIIRLFGNPDRAIRVCLLDNLPLMIDQLSQKIVNDKIFPQLVCPSSLIRKPRLTTIDYRLHRRNTCSKGADSQVGACYYHKTFGPHNQRRPPQTARENSE